MANTARQIRTLYRQGAEDAKKLGCLINHFKSFTTFFLAFLASLAVRVLFLKQCR
jgi:hypothetical protein